MIWLILIPVILICVSVLLVLLSRHKTPHKPVTDDEQSGIDGEDVVARFLCKFGTVFNNYIIVNDWNQSCEIDHILVNSCGIFIIETKNWYGTLYGNKDDKNWELYRNGKTDYRRNPVRQNEYHVWAFNKFFKQNITVFACVVFLRTDIENVQADNVFTLGSFKEFLESKQSKYSENQVKNYCLLLKEKRSTITHEQHLANIRKTQQALDDGICPLCGNKLRIRISDKTYLECSDYPKCKYKRKM